MKKKISRRKFVVRTLLGGTGVILGTAYLARNPIRRALADFANTGETPYLGNTDDLDIWFSIDSDNHVVLHSPKVEMGQGSLTGLAQIAADELEVDVKQMKVAHAVSASGNLDSFATGGSTSISSLWQPLRELAATMREMLRNEAARQWGVESSTLTIAKGVISGNGQSITYGDVVQGVEEWDVPDTPATEGHQKLSIRRETRAKS